MKQNDIARNAAKRLRAMATRIENHPKEFHDYDLYQNLGSGIAPETRLEIEVIGIESFSFMREIKEELKK